ncbi:MAG: thioredoxin family protein [Deltaproteobacteria bacterium]|nr:thioredoxin family protein [Deltaproteobacteria bacterium]
MSGNKSNIITLWVALAFVGLLFGGCESEEPDASLPEHSGAVPVKGMVTLVDLGADYCVPCKMMKPIITKLEKKYRGKAAILFIDVSKDKEQATRFGIRAIPTQIFFDKSGKEVHRHTGFMSEADIVSTLREMGVG